MATTKDELLERAQEAGLDVNSSMTKAELEDALDGTDAPALPDIETRIRHLDGCPEADREPGDGDDARRTENFAALRPRKHQPDELVLVARCIECGQSLVEPQ